MAQRPIAIGLLTCEQVIVEEHTHNVTVVNCFRQRYAEYFPTGPFPITVFALLTDGVGDIRLEVVIQRLDDLNVIYSQRFQAHFLDQLREARFIWRIKDCVFPVAGHYNVLLLADGEPIAQRRIEIHDRGITS